MKIKIILCFLFLSSIFSIKSQEYHFQEGFVTSSPSGWTRNCGGTNSVSAGNFSGNYSVKFDDQGNDGPDKALLSPTVSDAGTLSFWLFKNANATKMNLHVVKIVGNVETEVLYVPITNLTSNKTWFQFSVDIDESANVQLKFWADKEDGSTSYIALDDIELSEYTGEKPQPLPVDRIETGFGDASWGTPVTNGSTNLPKSGEYPSSEVNGFKLINAVLYGNKPAVPDGNGSYTNTIAVDKSSEGGVIEFPVVKTVGEIEIHAMSGSDDKGYFLQEYVNGTWVNIGSQIKTDKVISIYKDQIIRESESKFRIANATGSGLFVAKIVVRSLIETRELNIVSSTPFEGQVVYYNLTKNIQLTFNKNIVKGSGQVSLNGEVLDPEGFVVSGNVVTIPVTLTGVKTGNTDFALTVSGGAFAEAGNQSNLSNEKIIAFQTSKTANVPDNYNKEIDVFYSSKSPNCRMDIYWPADAVKSSTGIPLLVNTHGGGWNHGEKEAQSGFRLFTDMGFAVANVEYRMYPEATAPAAVEDLRSALIYMIKNASTYNIDINKIVVQGSSAGAHLVTAAAYLQNDRRYDGEYEDFTGDVKVMAVVDRFGPVDLPNFLFYKSLENWLGEYATDDAFIKSISPVYLVDSKTPPTYIVHGDADPTVPYSQSVTLFSKLQEAGIKSQFTTVPDGGHGGFNAEYNTRIENEIKTFINELMDISTSVIIPDSNNKIDYSITDHKMIIHTEGKNITGSLYNTVGQLVKEIRGNEIDLPSGGIYIVKITVDNDPFIAKIQH